MDNNINLDGCKYQYAMASKLKDIACQRNLAKLKRLDGCNSNDEEKYMLDDWYRDDSFLGNPAERHIMYKLGKPLISRDGKRAYEFLIEFDVNDPSIGIYYGVKGLILEGNLQDQIEMFMKEFYGLSMEDYIQGRDPYHAESLQIIISKYLNATFPDKDFLQRFRFTDNANDNTFWPFWIAADPEEDIIWETARVVSIIKRIYKERVNDGKDLHGLWELSDPQCPISDKNRKKLKCIGEVESQFKKLQITKPFTVNAEVRSAYINRIRFTNESYRLFMERLGSQRACGIFDKLVGILERRNIIHRSSLLEKGYEIHSGKIGVVAKILRIFWVSLQEEDRDVSKYDDYSSLFRDIISIFITDKMTLLSENFKNRANLSKKGGASKDFSYEDLSKLVFEAKCHYCKVLI